jgi:hypothetical protein
LAFFGASNSASSYTLPISWRERCWFASSLLLNCASIASIAEQVIQRPSVLTRALEEYHRFVGGWLGSIPVLGIIGDPTHWVGIAVTLMGGVFCAANFYMLRSDGVTVIGFLFDRTRFHGRLVYRTIISCARAIALYLLGPIICLRAFYNAIIKRAPYQTEFDFTFQPHKVLLYYMSVVVGVVGALFLANAIAP